ncbi:MAG: aminoacetone oxidase family FAD-binding enzyme [Oscillospiraceae bacterium]|nr:aminoacetone oxidase family FAD-binding enzyme [Oscillospiraceae bacterium]
MHSESRRRVAVIGGGAGGLCAAIAAAGEGAAVTIYERQNRVGKKLLKTGNGRCNLTNEHLTGSDYNHPDFVAPQLAACGTAALRAFFASLGLWTVADSEGRVYPRSDTAASVLDVLRLRCAALGVAEDCSRELISLKKRGERWRLRFREGEGAECEAVIVAVGGGVDLLSPLGHSAVPFSPILCPLRTDAAPIKGLSGLRVKGTVRLFRGTKLLCEEAGEVLFRDGGVSGIVILNMSRFASPGCTLSIDLMPEMSREDLAAALGERNMPREELFTGIFHKRIGEALLRAVPDADCDKLVTLIKDYRLAVTGVADAAGAQVTRGGANVEEFDPHTLQSRLYEGLYAIGETLDIDGRCGGYNLHWAFASGLAAGRSAGRG